MATQEAPLGMKPCAGKQAIARSYCISSADVEGPAVSGSERLKAHEKLHKKDMGTVRRHRQALGIM